jgi:hypothetical protein
MSDLGYIDDVIDRELKDRHAKAPSTLDDADRANAKKTTRKVVAGFQIGDEAAERKMLDDMIADRRAMIDLFLLERAKITEKLAAKSIKPLAVVPTKAWHAICDQAKLFRLSPDAQGHVGVNPAGLQTFCMHTTQQKTGMFGNKFKSDHYNISEAGYESLEDKAKTDWPGYLQMVFGGLAPVMNTGRYVTVILPNPPEDVQAILLKAHGTFTMKVAAVPDAISLKETPREILAGVVKSLEEEARRQEAWKADPIIYIEEGVVTAIIAQFGDFPIEKIVVDAVVKSKDLLPDKPTPVQTMGVLGQGGLVQQYYNQYQQVGGGGGLLYPGTGGGGFVPLGYGISTGYTGTTAPVNSVIWTG